MMKVMDTDTVVDKMCNVLSSKCMCTCMCFTEVTGCGEIRLVRDSFVLIYRIPSRDK